MPHYLHFKSFVIRNFLGNSNEKFHRAGLCNAVVFIDCPGTGFWRWSQSLCNWFELDFSVGLTKNINARSGVANIDVEAEDALFIECRR
jgi:hypothetical protein